MDVTKNQFISDFFCLNPESSSFEIAAELSFHDREFIFRDLLLRIYGIIGLASHHQMICIADKVMIRSGW